MSDFAIVRAVSEGLRTLLDQHLSGYFTNATVDLRSPRDVGAPNATPQVSLWLYRITRSDFLNNDAPPRPSANTAARWPIAVNLFYLVTPIHQNEATRHEMLGAILQTFNDHSILFGNDLGTPPPLTDQAVRVTMDTLTLEELTQVWYALQESYQLSASYQAQFVSIDSAHGPDRVEPVLQRQSDYWQIVGGPR